MYIKAAANKMLALLFILFMKIMRGNPIETGEIANNLYAAKTGTVNFFLYKYNDDIICIDSGFGRDLIKSQLDILGIDPAEITNLFLTHSDFDHAGGLSLFDHAKVFLCVDEEQMISRRKARMFGAIYNNNIKRAYQLLKDNDVVTIGPVKVRAIATPGHTPGSMSYVVNESILFSGDTFKLVEGKVAPLRRYINMDTEQQKESIAKLASLENIRLACTAHSGYTEKFRDAIGGWHPDR